jgi:acyl transferase domain-containing protein/acyl carrier protein
MSDKEFVEGPEEVAVIGMCGRFPGARNIDEFWHNLQHGVESISFFTDTELQASGIGEVVLRHPNYVKAKAILDDIDLFDASFFGFNPREAEVMDPQHRVFLECAAEALVHAAYNPEMFKGAIGVYAGLSMNSYYLTNLSSNRDIVNSVGVFQTMLGNDKDFLPTRVSYKLNLRGPSLSVQTACSTSLVAVHLACQSVLNGECDIALAGGISITVPQKNGYFYQADGIASPDGHCRPFDAGAKGTVGGNGVGIVVLRRLSDALADGDCIHAVIKGSAVNNDGSTKVGYTAPSVEGQAAAISEALTMASVTAESISYVEAHGTGTIMGDPIEVAALKQVFGAHTQEKGFCALGSVKGNIGHLDAAAGVAGLIKAILALKNRLLPPSIHLDQPNPELGLDDSAFYVNTELKEWEPGSTPRRAGVSSFGIGGTNAHVVIEEAPRISDSGVSRPWQLLLLSARTEAALEKSSAELGEHLRHDELNLADVAHTLQVGRRVFGYRQMVLCRDLKDAAAALETRDAKQLARAAHEGQGRKVVFMFPGQGSQFPDMAKGLFEAEPTFRRHVEYCSKRLAPLLGFDLHEVLYPMVANAAAAAQLLKQTQVTQVALFVVEYGLAKLWMRWGVLPHAMIGHSIGEYVAACLAGVFSLEDALVLVAARGRLMMQMPEGVMLAVALPEEEVEPLLPKDLSMAAVNAPQACVVSGSNEAIERLAVQLAAREVKCRRLQTSHAFHSAMVEPILGEFTEEVSKIRLTAPTLPYISNVTGKWITVEEATDASYWAKHLRQTVRFSDGVQELQHESDAVWLEVGPGHTLSTLARQQVERERERVILSSLARGPEGEYDVATVLKALGRLWLSGVEIDWAGFYGDERRHRLVLPPYPFERKRYWIEPRRGVEQGESEASLSQMADPAEWLYVPLWKQTTAAVSVEQDDLTAADSCWVVFTDDCGVGARIVERLKQDVENVFVVEPGNQFDKLDQRTYRINGQRKVDYETLFDEVSAQSERPLKILYLWGVTAEDARQAGRQFAGENSDLVVGGLLHVAQALAGRQVVAPVQIAVVSNSTQQLTGNDELCPEKAMILGAVEVISKEYPNTTCRSFDVVSPTRLNRWTSQVIDNLIADFEATGGETAIAHRGNTRWVQAFEPLRREPPLDASRIREGGVYLITHGLRDVGLSLAESMAAAANGLKLVLTRRRPFPARVEWDQWLAGGKQDEVSRKISKIRKLEAEGTEFLILEADVADAAQMKLALALATGRFGSVIGVFHAVIDDGENRIAEQTPEALMAALRDKSRELLVLAESIKDIKPDFLFLCSSQSSLLGGVGRLLGCAERAFLDAFAQRSDSTGDYLTVSVNSDAWHDEETAAATVTALSADLDPAPRAGNTPAEGVQLLRRILSSKLPRVIVSRRDLRAVAEQRGLLTAARQNPDAEQVQPVGSTHERPDLTSVYAAPHNVIEQTIIDIWQEMLGFAPIGIYDNFFELGGHSLLATQLTSSLSSRFDVKLPLRDVFESPTVAELAEIIGQRTSAGQATPDAPIIRLEREGELPISFAQQRLWFLDQMEAGGAAGYSIPEALRLRGILRPTVLRAALSEIVHRHEVLRSHFTSRDGQPQLEFSPAAEVALPVVDLSALPDPDREAEAARLARAEAARPFDLARDLLLRAVLLRLGTDDHIGLFTIHHIASDAWSLSVLVRELTALYTSFHAGAPSPLAALPIQYVDYAEWQRQLMDGPALDEHLAYWRRQLGGRLPVLKVPGDHARPAVQAACGARLRFAVRPELAAGLRALSQREGVTLFMTLLAAFQVLLYRLSGEADVLVGTAVAGRPRPETEGLIGLFVNTVVMRSDLSDQPRFQDFLGRVRETCLGAYAHQAVPFERVVEHLRPERDTGHMPVCQVAFGLLNGTVRKVQLPDLEMKPADYGVGTARFDLTLWMDEDGDELNGSWSYRTDLYKEERVAGWGQQYIRVLETVCADADARVGRQEVATPDERERQREVEREWAEAAAGQLLTRRRKLVTV